MNINDPIKNPKLVTSMKELKDNYTQITEHNFFKELLEATAILGHSLMESVEVLDKE